jgi:hypothetical protein
MVFKVPNRRSLFLTLQMLKRQQLKLPQPQLLRLLRRRQLLHSFLLNSLEPLSKQLFRKNQLLTLEDL